jgi:hypothetical protein
MSIHNIPDANPAFLFALCRSLHALEAGEHEVDGLAELYRHVGLGDKGRVKACFDSAKAAGILVDAEDCSRDTEVEEGYVLADPWHDACQQDSTPLDFALCANRNLVVESNSWGLLWHVGQRLFEEQVFGEAEPFDRVLERWNRAPGDLPEISINKTKMDDLSRWLYFLGWVRRFGQRQMVPDFSPWLLGWLDRNPRTGVEDAGDFWTALQRALPVASSCSLDSDVPEALSVAMFTLEARQIVEFRTVSDSPKPMMRLGVASKRAEAHELVWSGGMGK